MTTFGSIKTLVHTGLARDTTDPAALLVVPAAINWAIQAAAILFKPKELATSDDVTVLAGKTLVEFDYNFIDIQSVVPVLSVGKDLHFIPYESFRTLVPWVTSDPEYYTMFGKFIVINAIAGSNIALRVFWLQLPDDLDDDEDDLPFVGQDGFIVSLASALAFAMFEEGETVDVWTKMSEILGMPLIQRTKMPEVMQGIPASLEAKLSGTLAGGK